jgi:hypothetical protein
MERQEHTRAYKDTQGQRKGAHRRHLLHGMPPLVAHPAPRIYCTPPFLHHFCVRGLVDWRANNGLTPSTPHCPLNNNPKNSLRLILPASCAPPIQKTLSTTGCIRYSSTPSDTLAKRRCTCTKYCPQPPSSYQDLSGSLDLKEAKYRHPAPQLGQLSEAARSKSLELKLRKLQCHQAKPIPSHIRIHTSPSSTALTCVPPTPVRHAIEAENNASLQTGSPRRG